MVRKIKIKKGVEMAISMVKKNNVKSLKYISADLLEPAAGGSGIKVSFAYDVSDERYHGNVDWEKFNRNEDNLFEVFKIIMDFEMQAYIFSYDPYNEFCGINRLLTELGTAEERNCDTGICTDDPDIIRGIFDKSLKYEAFPVFFTYDLKCAVTPTDHLDMFVIAEMGSISEIIDRLNGYEWFRRTFIISYI